MFTYDDNGNILQKTLDDVTDTYTYSDLDLYYCGSRYYNWETCRLINADSQIAGVGVDVPVNQMITEPLSQSSSKKSTT